jgi:UDP:flavonoid glycosyltransferase YjiC (YdhE family)
VVREVAALRPALVVSETFAVIGRVVASSLGLPAVNVCAGHNLHPARALSLLAGHPGAYVSAECRRAVESLRDDHGLEDASPLCYATGLSRELNVYCEPPAYLDEEDRRAFEPVAFYGSLPADRGLGEPPAGRDDGPGLNVYVCFGTVAWRYWTPEALDVLSAISSALGRMPDTRAVISLGGTEVPGATIAELSRPNVRVERWVDQWSELAAADVCITHNGLNSTHEAVFHRVPMLSYPFFGDQPGLARRCQELGVALALAEAPLAVVGEEDVVDALARFRAQRERLGENIAQARRWELETVAQRANVIRRMVDLAGVTA